MNGFLSDKHVIFFDVGYTIDYPASGDWMFTNRFNELAGERLKQCSETQIRKAREAGAGFLDKDHLIHTQEEEAEQFYQYYRIVSENLKLELTDNEITTIARDRTYNMDNP